VISSGVSFTSPEQEEFIMSARNGDRSRYHRVRKQKIARRQRTRELLNRAAAERKSVENSGSAKPRSISE
jgi:hypothetical protein